MIIKCPECGRQVSERAPQCPNCGAEIAGKIVQCANCGEVYFLADRVCPECHQINGRLSTRNTMPPAESHHVSQTDTMQEPETPQPKKRNYTALILSFVFAVIICGGMFYMYYNSRNANEIKEYELAIKSDDPLILEAYINKFKDGNPDHYKQIKERLGAIKYAENEWNNTLLANNTDQYRAYINSHPNSIHCQEAKNKIDSIDWSIASVGGEAALKRYLSDHANGQHVSDAELKLEEIYNKAIEETQKNDEESTEKKDAEEKNEDKKVEKKEEKKDEKKEEKKDEKKSDNTVQASDKDKVKGVCRKFFQAMNTKGGEASLKSTLSSSNSVNGKTDGGVSYMRSQYDAKEKNQDKNFNWRISSDSYKIDKKSSGGYQATFKATKEIETKDGKKKTETHNVTATITSDGKISNINIR